MTDSLSLLAKLVTEDMKARGLAPEFSLEELAELEQINQPAAPEDPFTDLRSLLWCSIDNDDSQDLDQLTYAEKKPDGTTDLYML
jgi:exoribonuclease II